MSAMPNKRYLLFFAFLLLLISCKKDSGFSSVPNISFIEIKPSYWVESFDPNVGPTLSFQLKDAEGDFNFSGRDSSYVYLKTTSVNYDGDSLVNDGLRLYKFPFPDLSEWSDRSNMDVRMDILMNNLRRGYENFPVDTFYFDIWVQDLAGNKSNVIQNTVPLLYQWR